MADVYIVFGTLLAVGIAFPGLLSAWRLLFPTATQVAQERIARTPGAVFATGLGLTILFAIPVFLLIAVSVPLTSITAAALVFLILAVSVTGAAGITGHMAARLREANENLGPMKSYIGAAVAFELAAAFPFVGWFIVIPAALLLSIGATFFGVVRWRPRALVQAAPSPAESASPAQA